jgi:hypothetical protein
MGAEKSSVHVRACPYLQYTTQVDDQMVKIQKIVIIVMVEFRCSYDKKGIHCIVSKLFVYMFISCCNL